MLKARVHPADETDGEGAKPLLAGLDRVFPRLALIWVDGGYKRRFAEWVAAELGWRVEVVQHPDAGLRWVWVGPGQEPPPRPRAASGCCRGAGWWSGPSPGWAATAASARTTRRCPRPRRPGSTPPQAGSSCAGSPDDPFPHRLLDAASAIAYRRVNVRCVTPLGDETASTS